MDRVIEKKKWSEKKILTTVGITAIIALLAASYYFTTGKSKLNVDTDRVTISEIKKGTFQEFIPVNGVVLPLTTIYLDAVEGGRVEEKYVDDGAMMKKGQPILRLSNTDLQLGLVTQQTNVYNLLTQMQISKNAAQQNTVSKLNQMTDVESQLKEAERVYKLDKYLYAQKAFACPGIKKENEDERISMSPLHQNIFCNCLSIQHPDDTMAITCIVLAVCNHHYSGSLFVQFCQHLHDFISI